MLKSILLVSGVLVTLGTTVSGSSSDSQQATSMVRYEAAHAMSTSDGERLLAELRVRTASPTFIPLARPL
jgi:hypothetical protein